MSGREDRTLVVCAKAIKLAQKNAGRRLSEPEQLAVLEHSPDDYIRENAAVLLADAKVDFGARRHLPRSARSAICT